MANLWQLERRDGTAVIRYHNPPSNLFVLDALLGLHRVLDQVQAALDDRVVIITGLPEIFGAGLDLREFPADESALRTWLCAGEAINRRVEGFPRPVLAAIEGPCYGGALEFALACHIRIGSATARFAQPEIFLGSIPAGGGTQRLPRLIGRGRALQYLLTGATMKGDEAARLGLLDVLVPAGRAVQEAERIARRIARQEPLLTQAILDVVNRGIDLSLDEALALERSTVLNIMRSSRAAIRRPRDGAPREARRSAS